MNYLDVVSILVFSFGALAYSAFALLWLQEFRAQTRVLSWVEGFFTLYAAAWFLVNLALVFGQVYPEGTRPVIALVRFEMTFLWPPVMMHSVYAGCASRLVSRKPWRRILVLSYTATVAVVAALTLTAFRHGGPWSSPWIDATLIGLFLAAGIYAAALIYKAPSPSGQRRTRDPVLLRAYRSWAWALLALLVIILAVDLWIVRSEALNELLSLAARSFPLFFLFINTYYLERFTFFDVFIKRGTFSLLVLALLTLYSFFAVQLLSPATLGGFAPWALALTLLPLALTFPWIYRKLERWLDRVWWGRRFGPVEAVKYFLAGIQHSTTEDQLVRRAQERLAAIFQADTQILVAGESSSPSFESVLDIPITVSGESTGTLRVGPRLEAMPYFSKDVTLLATLADVFAYMLENIRLQQKKQDQETRERELTIHASRSELKALRAQINPHFLFNALNAIAGLVHKNPNRAEDTVEQLSEVFRYTLSGSEKEWAQLEDEIDFVRSYLEVEQARFGDRLRVSIDLDEAAKKVEIPTMVVQTLVENAVKHGVALLRGTGTISVRVRRQDDLVTIQVEDNGPGPVANQAGAKGYGLRNIRERLQGYYGDGAKLDILRNDSPGRTVASVVLPISSTLQQKHGSS